MEAARLREWYSAAQALIAELGSKSADPESQRNPDFDLHNKHFHLYRLVHRIKKGAGKVKQGESRAIWSERAGTLQAEVQELTRSIIQNADKDTVPSLLAAGASTAEGLESDKASLQESVQAAKYTCEALEATISEHASAREQEAATLLELRTRTVVLQQDVRQREADARELVQRLQGAVKEKEALAGEKERMEEDVRARAQLAESQGQVIAQLMADSEESKRELEGLRKRVTEAEQEAHVLRVNLGNHGQVIEKLILLNSEMMEAGNKYAAWKETHEAGGAKSNETGEDGEKRTNVSGDRRGPTEEGAAGSSNGVAGEGTRERRGVETGARKQAVRAEESRTEAGASDDELPVSGTSAETGGKEFAANRRPQGLSEESDEVDKRPSIRVESRKPGQDSKSGDARAKPVDRDQEAGGGVEAQSAQSSTSNGHAAEIPRKPLKWTSDMLPLSQRPTSPPPQRDEAPQGQPDAAGWVGSKIQGVGGRARGLLNYVAGMDKAPTATT
ncbi:hypothetical protein KFL_004510020 [Klebsormidium nitens]|uniref:Uncharacterized protein n=1 Tax=Klebsormidium nitens TaxID=105231 RepID=A0A1Y1ICI6_KLENI|nr:hypothetical protein KFL_004510020 [Klebsormidium nitens]|eukprot:GAQ88675.1 hypothetical protein KFL_004510020 [Klebsormidium nitens]